MREHDTREENASEKGTLEKGTAIFLVTGKHDENKGDERRKSTETQQ
jgi:hypothetical protein